MPKHFDPKEEKGLKVDYTKPFKPVREESVGDDMLKLTAEEKFRKYFEPVSRPTEKPQLPDNISSLAWEGLSELQLRYGTWREYTEDLLMDSLPVYTRAQEDYEHHYDLTLLSQTKTRVKDNQTLARTEETVHAKYKILQEAEIFHKLLTSKLEQYNNCLTIISREITARGNNK